MKRRERSLWARCVPLRSISRERAARSHRYRPQLSLIGAALRSLEQAAGVAMSSRRESFSIRARGSLGSFQNLAHKEVLACT